MPPAKDGWLYTFAGAALNAHPHREEAGVVEIERQDVEVGAIAWVLLTVRMEAR